ncbi:MAG: hypothetical protein AB8F65_06185 [Woeseiaceae bacterium]
MFNSVSFEEKSVWIQLIGLSITVGGYFWVAGHMLAAGVTHVAAYIPVFAVSVVLLVIILTGGHVLAAITSRSHEPDERDRVIGWRAESLSSWILGFGVITSILALGSSVEPVWVAHLLLLSMLVTEIVRFILQIVFYRRGM